MGARYKLDIDKVGQTTRAVISGIIDEGAEFESFAGFSGDVEIDLADVRRINSFGVRLWIEAMRKIPEGAQVAVVRCAPPMVEQMNMIHNFFGKARLRSFYAPMICPECEEQKNELCEASACRSSGGLPEVTCPDCDATMEVDDIEDQYLFFLKIDSEEL